jgi:hypothetical protein
MFSCSVGARFFLTEEIFVDDHRGATQYLVAGRHWNLYRPDQELYWQGLGRIHCVTELDAYMRIVVREGHKRSVKITGETSEIEMQIADTIKSAA